MNKFIIFFLLVSFFCSCSNRTENVKPTSNPGPQNMEVISEYKNYYENDSLLVRVEVTHTSPVSSRMEEWTYSYDPKDNKLLSERKHTIREDGSKELYSIKEYRNKEKIFILIEENDTTTFERQYYDTKGNVARSIYKDRFPESLGSENYIIIDKDEIFEYDTDNRLTAINTKDIINKEMIKTKFTFKMNQDTLIKEMYKNEKLVGITRIFSNNTHSFEYYYSPDNILERKIEKIQLENDSLIEVEHSFAGCTIIDSTIYVKGKDVRNTITSPDQIRTTVKEYDQKNNLVKEINLF